MSEHSSHKVHYWEFKLPLATRQVEGLTSDQAAGLNAVVQAVADETPDVAAKLTVGPPDTSTVQFWAPPPSTSTTTRMAATSSATDPGGVTT